MAPGASRQSTVLRNSAPPANERVAPQLADLMAQSRRATALPAWTRSVRARQTGAYLATMKGRGMEYAESRPYQAGDDIRALDWRVTARSGKPHTKLFREERERPVYVVVDYRRAMFFATHGVFKTVLAARTAALLAWKAAQTGDRIGGIVFSDTVHRELPPGRGNLAAIRFIKHLVADCRQPTADGAAAAVAGALARLRRVVKPGSLVFLLSDGREFGDQACSDFALLARHNDVMLMFIYDEFEAALPDLNGELRVADGRRELNILLGERELHAAYVARYLARRDALARLCRDNRILFAPLATTMDPLVVLQRALGAR